MRSVSPATLQGLAVPPRRWLVPDWIPWQTVTGLYGDGGLGKSLLAQQLLTATAIAKPWIGLNVTRVRSVGVFCEDPKDELHRRQADINQFYGCDMADLADALWLPRFGENNILMTFSGGQGTLTAFFNQLLQEARRFEAQLIVIDTVADTFGGNENDRGHVRQFMQGCLGRLARDIDGCVLALAHPSRAGMETGSGDSGSTGWSNSLRSRLSLDLPKTDKGAAPDINARLLSRKKANYAARDEHIRLRYHNGVLIPEKLVSAAQRRSADAVFLDILDTMTLESRPVSDSSRAPNYAPRLFAKRPERDGHTKRDFEAAMDRLFASGDIVNKEYGRKSDLRRRIVRSAGSAVMLDDAAE